MHMGLGPVTLHLFMFLRPLCSASMGVCLSSPRDPRSTSMEEIMSLFSVWKVCEKREAMLPLSAPTPEGASKKQGLRLRAKDKQQGFPHSENSVWDPTSQKLALSVVSQEADLGPPFLVSDGATEGKKLPELPLETSLLLSSAVCHGFNKMLKPQSSPFLEAALSITCSEEGS